MEDLLPITEQRHSDIVLTFVDGRVPQPHTAEVVLTSVRDLVEARGEVEGADLDPHRVELQRRSHVRA